MHLLIVAKQPVPGRAKTRLIPAYGAEGAAALAAAALADTFEAAAGCGADRVVVAFDGDPAGLVPASFEVVPQCAGDLAARLTQAWLDVDGPGLQIGMDTPQVGPSDLDDALETLASPGTEAVLGPATDGGWWAIGFLAFPPTAFVGIPTSRSDTGERQRARLRSLGLATTMLPTASDVDLAEDVALAAAAAPSSRFAETAHRLDAERQRSTGRRRPVGSRR